MTINNERSGNYSIITGCILILAILFLVSLSGSFPVLKLFGIAQINATLFFISRILYWISLLLLWLYATKIEKRKLLILEEKRYKFLIYLLSVIVIFLVLFGGLLIIQQVLSLTGVNEKSTRLSELIAIFRGSKALLVFTALTAGVVEELIFRGYLQPRFEIIFKSPYIAILLSSVLFGLLHYRYGTLLNIAGPFFIGFIFACYYWKYRNIKILILCHFLWDLVASLILIKMN